MYKISVHAIYYIILAIIISLLVSMHANRTVLDYHMFEYGLVISETQYSICDCMCIVGELQVHVQILITTEPVKSCAYTVWLIEAYTLVIKLCIMHM